MLFCALFENDLIGDIYLLLIVFVYLVKSICVSGVLRSSVGATHKSSWIIRFPSSRSINGDRRKGHDILYRLKQNISSLSSQDCPINDLQTVYQVWNINHLPRSL